LKITAWAITALLSVFVSSNGFAQTATARLVGIVHDASGAAIPNAKVTATQDATRQKTETTTNPSGEYVLSALQPGTYTLNVEAGGFRKGLVTGLELDAAANVSQLVTLEVGQVTEVVEVKANVVSVQTADAQVSQSITMSDIATLPQLGRTPITLAIFQPGVQINPQADGSSSGADYSFAHVNGLRQGSNNNTLDGIDVNDSVAPRIGLSLTANNTDSVEEARIVTDGGKAEYGRSAGAQVQLVTRGGTNQLHGNAFDYIRNRDLNANDFFSNSAGLPIPVLIQNTFGGSVGGPIKHNKIFFFGNYQGIRTHAQGVKIPPCPPPRPSKASSNGFRPAEPCSSTASLPTIPCIRASIPLWRAAEAVSRPQQFQCRRWLELRGLSAQLPERQSVRSVHHQDGLQLLRPDPLLRAHQLAAEHRDRFVERRAERSSGRGAGHPGRKALGRGGRHGLDALADHGQRIPLRPPERIGGFQPPGARRGTDGEL
jgi:hypothetical protein